MSPNRALLRSSAARDEAALAASLLSRLDKAGLTAEQSTALAGAVDNNRVALSGLLMALQGAPAATLNPWEQALWMLLADFLAASVPILPFVFAPIPQARVISAVVTLGLLIGLGIGRARIAKRSLLRTVTETVSIGVAAALAGVIISVLIDRGFHG